MALTQDNDEERRVRIEQVLMKAAALARRRASAMSASSQRCLIQTIDERLWTLTERLDTMPKLVKAIVAFLTDNLAEPFTLAIVGKAVRRNPSYVSYVFRQWTGITVQQFATALRMTLAADAVEHGVKVEAVAKAFGYRSRQTFYRHFRGWYGTVPSTMRVHATAEIESAQFAEAKQD